MRNERGEKTEFPNLHVVDVADDDDNFFYAILQCLNPSTRYIDSSPWCKEAAEKLRKDLYPDKLGRISFDFTRKDWDFLEKNLNREVIVLDITSIDKNCVKHLNKNRGSWRLHNVSDDYKQAIILLWRGDHWQAVLPN